MKTHYILSVCLFALLTGSLTSCLKDGLNKNEPVVDPPMTDPFDFATIKKSIINLDLGVNANSVLIEIYTENPVKTQASVVNGVEYSYFEKRDDIKPILRAIADENGQLEDIVNLPAGMKIVYLYTNYIGLPLVTAVDVKSGDITYSVNNIAKSESRSFSTRAPRYPEGFMILGEWDDNSIPKYLNNTRNTYPAEALYSLNKAVFYANNHFEGWEYLNDNCYTNIDVVKNTAVNLSYLGGSASMQNTLCYYHYPTNQKPANIADAKLIILFPNATFPTGSRKGLSSGDNVNLKYWNSEKKQFENTFPAGVTISFAILPNSFKVGGTIQPNSYGDKAFYSQPELNTSEAENTKRHCILFHDAENKLFTFLFEDRPRKETMQEGVNPGGDFRDAMVYLKASVEDAISSENIPELPDYGDIKPDVSGNITETEGTLIFEDRWPSEYDYDMNDAVIEYKSMTYRNKNNKVTKIVDEFRPIYNGGILPIAFGYQFSNIKYESWISSLTREPSLSLPDFTLNPKGLELRQDYPTVIVFDNIKNALNKSYTVTTEFTSAPQDYINVMPPYNPFIIIMNNANGRGTEVHLTDHAPTSLADKTKFGTADDISDLSLKKYYISKNNQFPFAMVVPRTGFIPQEGIRIDKQYPNFTEWVTSKGNLSQGWYK